MPIELNGALEVVAELQTAIGEGPLWDDRAGKLVFVDSLAGRIYRLDPLSGTITSIEVDQHIGAAVPRQSGGFVVSGQTGLLWVEEAGAHGLLVPIEEGRPNSRLNDAKCDSRGRLWSGTIPIEHERQACSLYRIDADLTVSEIQSGISVSNGLAWNPDETILYYVDTMSGGVDMFDYDIDSGTGHNRRRFVDIDRSHGLADGITTDAEGCLWVALYLGGAVRRYSPDGEWLAQITMPVSAVTSCGFGGTTLSDLYITTGRFGASPTKLIEQPLAGALFRCQPGVAGLPINRFAG